MKTTKEVKEKISQLEEQSKQRLDQKEYKALQKEVHFLRCVLLYLITEPRQEFVQKQLDDLLKKKKSIADGFEHFRNNRTNDGKNISQQKSEYDSLMRTKEIFLQIRHLQFILG